MEALKGISDLSSGNGKIIEPAITEVETVAEEPLLGPVLPEAETEDDPYNLPITHEVTLEGNSASPTAYLHVLKDLYPVSSHALPDSRAECRH